MSDGKNLHRWVLIACALANADEYGYFTASYVRTPFNMLMKKDCPISLFSQHLHAFCDDKHGPALHRTAVARGYRYKFKNAMMQPYVIMKALEGKVIT